MFVNVAAQGLGAVRRFPNRRVITLLPRRRGVSGLGWLPFPYYTATQIEVPVPQPGGVTDMPTAETELQNAAQQDIRDWSQFTAANNSPNYSNPAAYTANMIAFARTLCQHSWSAYTCPPGFNPDVKGTQYANLVFSTLKQIPVNPNDPNSISVYAKWIASPPAVTPGYELPPLQQPFTPSSLPPQIVAQLPAAVQNYVPPPNPTPVYTATSSPAPVSSAPGVQTWLPPIFGGSPAPGGSAAGSVDLSFLTNPISIFGYNVPLWGLIAGGVGVVFVAGSMGKGR